jgi:putative transposase
MKKSRFTEEQIVAILKESEEGVPNKEICRKHGISDATFYHWRSKYGGMNVSDVKRLKSLQDENAQRRACGLVEIPRATRRHKSQRRDDSELRTKIIDFATVRRRFGYRRITWLLQRTGQSVGRTRVYRIYCEENPGAQA